MNKHILQIVQLAENETPVVYKGKEYTIASLHWVHEDGRIKEVIFLFDKIINQYVMAEIDEITYVDEGLIDRLNTILSDDKEDSNGVG